MVPVSEKTPLKALLSTRAFWAVMLMMAAAGSSELTMSQWSSLFAEKGLGVNKLLGDLLGPCLFALLMGTTRMLYGIYGDRINLNKALIASGGLCIVCYALAVFSLNPFLSLLGCALSGVAVALMWPGTISLTAARFPVGGTAMFGVMAICGDIGASVGPWLAGFVSDLTKRMGIFTDLSAATGLSAEQLGLKAGLLLGMAFPVLLVVSALLMARAKESEG
jgi:MFS family permease